MPLKLTALSLGAALALCACAKNVPQAELGEPSEPQAEVAVEEVAAEQVAQGEQVPEEPAEAATVPAEEPEQPVAVVESKEVKPVEKAPVAKGGGTKAPADPAKPAADPVKPVAATVPAAVAKPDAKVERQWKAKCGSCHGNDGKAATQKGKKMGIDDLTLAKWQSGKTDKKITDAILGGVKVTRNGAEQEMEGFKDELSAAEVAGLVQYIRWLGSAK